MFLAIDVGNTSVELGLFDECDLVDTYRLKFDPTRSTDDYCMSLSFFLERKKSPKTIDSILISSVVPSFNADILAICRKTFGIEADIIGPGYPSGIRVNTDNPKEVGSDLIADCAYAKSVYGGNCIVVDLGTASKIILCGKDGAFEGCVIAPGIGISLSALVGKAAQLGEVDIKIPARILGKNTSDSINSALTYGNAFAIKNLCDEIEKACKSPLKRIIGGGYAEVLLPLMEGYEYVPHLTLKGIKAIHDRRKQR